MAVNKFGQEGLTYEGILENKKWGRLETYGVPVLFVTASTAALSTSHQNCVICGFALRHA